MSSYFIGKLIICCSLTLMSLNQASLMAQNQTAAQTLKPNVSEEDLQKSAEAGQAWLNLVDQGKYENSWETGALTFQFTITKKEWQKALEISRSPLGKLVSRTLQEQRVAQNPKGLPGGEYMVLLYKTSFANRADANEVMTLQKQNNGDWKVLTYHVR